MTIRAVPARGLLLFVLVLAKPVLGVEPALPPTPADVSDWSRLLDAIPGPGFGVALEPGRVAASGSRFSKTPSAPAEVIR